MVNAVTFSGNITRDVEVKFSANGDARAHFSVAVNTGSKDKGNEKAHFIPVTAFGSLAENIGESFEKGSRVIVSGRFDSYSKEVEIDGDEVNLNMLTVIANTVGPDLTFATAEITKNPYGDDEKPKGKKSKSRDEDSDEKPKSKKSKAKKADDDEDDDDF